MHVQVHMRKVKLYLYKFTLTRTFVGNKAVS